MELDDPIRLFILSAAFLNIRADVTRLGPDDGCLHVEQRA
jgi:hypothetical protein